MLNKRNLSQRSYDFIYMKCPEQANLQRQKVNKWLPRSGGEGKRMGSDCL